MYAYNCILYIYIWYGCTSISFPAVCPRCVQYFGNLVGVWSNEHGCQGSSLLLLRGLSQLPLPLGSMQLPVPSRQRSQRRWQMRQSDTIGLRSHLICLRNGFMTASCSMLLENTIQNRAEGESGKSDALIVNAIDSARNRSDCPIYSHDIRWLDTSRPPIAGAAYEMMAEAVRKRCGRLFLWRWFWCDSV